jgi:hypothetical protein
LIPDEIDELFAEVRSLLANVGKEEAKLVLSLLEPLPAWLGPMFLGWLERTATVFSVLTIRAKAIDPHG